MEFKNRVTLYLVIFGSLALATYFGGNSAEGQSPDRGEVSMPLDCRSLDSFEKNDTLPAPDVDSLPPFTKDTSVYICWQSVQHEDVYKYYAVASPTKSFNEIEACDLDSVTFQFQCAKMTVTREDTVWYLVFFVDIDERLGPPSNTLYTVQDTTPPILGYIRARDPITGDTTATHSRNVEVHFEGKDILAGEENRSTCSSLQLWEDPGEYNMQPYQINTCCGMVTYQLSPQPGKKTICGRLIDKAGNAGNSVCTDIILIIASYNYPNPFNPRLPESTNIVFWLDKEGQEVTLSIYDLFGNLVLEKRMTGEQGMNEYKWDGRNGNREYVASGGYICIIDHGAGEPYKHKIAVLNR